MDNAVSSSKFYVYIILDPRNGFLPFYVGKGCGRRLHYTLMRSSNRANPFKQAIIDKIKAAGMFPFVIKLYENITETLALDLERSLIARFGRRCLRQNGILTNLTDGGEGGSGREVSEARREILRTQNPGGLANSRKIYQISSENGHILNTWDSARGAARATGIKQANISLCAQEKSTRTAGNYYWRLATSTELVNNVLDVESLKRKVVGLYQLDLDGNVLRYWDSYQAAGEFFHRFSLPSISEDGSAKVSGGFLWRKANSKEIINGRLITIEEVTIRRKFGTFHVRQFDQSGKYIRAWVDKKEIARHYKIDNSHFGKLMSLNDGWAFGFRWEAVRGVPDHDEPIAAHSV